MTYIPDSQLVLNSDGSVYHLHLFPDQIADDIILVGDPNRVNSISKLFDNIELKVSNREINTHTGTYHGKRITVLSTGMGTDNIDIVINELDALANINLETHEIKPEHRSLNFIRLGTSGAMQPDIAVGDSYVVAVYALGLDGLLHFYEKSTEVIEKEMTEAFVKHMNWSPLLPGPYVVKASEELLAKLGEGFQYGITATSPGFYGPQGRVLCLGLSDCRMNKNMESFSFEGQRICNFEMESSALYGLSRMLGHQALTICAIIANRVTEKFTSDYKPFMDKLIQTTLDRLVE
ncbi:MAG: nucleoside phosphorylase [Bacteroidales bacterium]|nr:nucleoside phosphorylase [Bacteroidales bacterium]